MTNQMEDAFLERLQERDAAVFSLSDTLDMKASIALVVVVFLAGQSGDLLKNSLPPWLYWEQVLSCVLVLVAGVASIQAMWPREHEAENVVEWGEWIDRLRNNHPEDEPSAKRAFYSGRVDRLKSRIEENERICRNKSYYVLWAFKLSAVALGLNVLGFLAPWITHVVS